MDKNELARRLMATFLEELHERVGELNSSLLALEKEDSGDEAEAHLQTLFRAAHSLKGAARAVNLEVIEQACHAFEDILEDIRKREQAISPAMFSLFYRAVDGIEDAEMRLRDEQTLDGSPLEDMVGELKDLLESLQSDGETTTDPVAAPPSAIPSATSSPADCARSEPEVVPKALRPPPASKTLRVAAQKLDDLLAQSGELLVARRRVESRSNDAASVRANLAALKLDWQQLGPELQKLLSEEITRTSAQPATVPISQKIFEKVNRFAQRLDRLDKSAEQLETRLAADSRVLKTACDALNDEVYRVRMLPFAEACEGLERAVRDMARETGKQIQLTINGQGVEVDRSVLEGLKDPLLHLVRNGVDHGIESADRRKAAAKPETGQITVAAELRGGHLEVTVSDDGQGIDLDSIRQRCQQRGLAVPQEDAQLARLMFLPGFSTADNVTSFSGRGVGLDVVESQVQSLHGSIQVCFEPNRGSHFVINVPLTLTTIRCVLAVADQQSYAFPTSSVRQILRFGREDLRTIGGKDVLLLDDAPIPVASLSEVLRQKRISTTTPAPSKLLAVLLGMADQRVALLVDELSAEQEVLVKNLGRRVRQLRHVSGATLLASGQIALVLNTSQLVSSALGQAGNQRLFPEVSETAASQARKRVLVVDDSVTTRALMKGILEAAGYEVTSAVDGEHAWEFLLHHEVDLVVSDIDMPRLDGIDLTTRIRESERLQELPVVLVTARATAEDRTRGVNAGANSYLVKSGFDQRHLLEAIQQLI